MGVPTGLAENVAILTTESLTSAISGASESPLDGRPAKLPEQKLSKTRQKITGNPFLPATLLYFSKLTALLMTYDDIVLLLGFYC